MKHQLDCPGEGACTIGRRPAAVVARSRGWGPGTIITGTDRFGTLALTITAIGEHNILTRYTTGRYSDEQTTTLANRCWGKVGERALEESFGLCVKCHLEANLSYMGMAACTECVEELEAILNAANEGRCVPCIECGTETKASGKMMCIKHLREKMAAEKAKAFADAETKRTK